MIIEGISKCSVSISDDGSREVIIHDKEFGDANVSRSLLFGDDISVALDQHSPDAVWWSVMTSEERHRLKIFQEGVYLRYMAHCRYYAKLAIKGLGDKETLEAVKDYVIILFSREKGALAHSLFQAIWWGHLLTTHQTATQAKKANDFLTPDLKIKTHEEFLAQMYSWERTQDITYEDMVETELQVSKNVEILKAVMEAFQQRGILLSSLAADRRAEKTSMGVSHVNTLSKGIADRVQNSVK